MHGEAHAEPGRVEVGAKLAPSWENHAGEREFAENTFKQGLSAGVGLLYGIQDSWSIQAEFLYATRGTGVEADGRELAQYDFTYLEFPVLVRFSRRLPVLASDDGRLPLSGYLILGPALSYLISAKEQDEGETRELPRDAVNSLDLTVIAGIGAAWELTPQWTASFEVRYDRGFRDAFSTGVESSNQAILLTLGVSYTLNDSDGDRLYGGLDRCPGEAEDRNGYRDADGCADAEEDDDRDGVFAGADQCPGQKEDKDGFADEDGCPDADNDGDGLVDGDDKCPNEAFPYNRAAQDDTRGCPPKDLPRVRVVEDRIVVTPPLQFPDNGYVLNATMRPLLDDVVKLMTTYYPNMRVRIEGHSDGNETLARGERRTAEEVNQQRSEDRARSVFNYLTGTEDGKPRLDPARLEVIGRGTAQPASHEGTDDGRASNRRVEFVIIENPVPPIPESP